MRKYGVSELVGGEILARPVYLENGQILLDEGTQIDKSYKESLLALNIQDIFIRDKYEKWERPNFYMEKSVIVSFQQELEEILSHHVYKDNKRLQKMQKLAEKMTEEICQIGNQNAIDIGERSNNLYEHIIYTTMWSIIVGKEYDFSKKQLEDITLGALLHDLGLCYVNVAYWNCCFEEMTPTEIFELKKHTIFAYTALEKETWIPEISKKMILFHHEKIDGSGYPLKQKSKEIECRIIQICDALDGILCGIERKKDTIEKALEEISDNQKYDGKMAKILEKRIARYPVGTCLQLENGESVTVIAQTENPFQPEIVEMQKETIHTRYLTEKIIHIF